jgi:hypothetical protein
VFIPVASVPLHPGGPRAAETRSLSLAVVVSAPRLRPLVPFGSFWYFPALHACPLQVTSITPALPSNQQLFVANLVLHVPPPASVRSRRSISCMLQYSISVRNRPCCQGGCFPTSRNKVAVPQQPNWCVSSKIYSASSVRIPSEAKPHLFVMFYFPVQLTCRLRRQSSSDQAQ